MLLHYMALSGNSTTEIFKLVLFNSKVMTSNKKESYIVIMFTILESFVERGSLMQQSRPIVE